jgi:hypothetical protein
LKFWIFDVEQLYKLSGGNQGGGLPPAASLLDRFKIPDFSP